MIFIQVNVRNIPRDASGVPLINATAFATNVIPDNSGGAQFAQALYNAVTGYLDQEMAANTQCKATMDAKLAEMMDPWTLMNACQNDVVGSWSSTYNQNIGKACTTDADCYGTSCATPVSSRSASTSTDSSSSTDKYCSTPKDKEAEVMMSCIMAKLNATGVVLMKNKIIGPGSERVSDASLTEKVVSITHRAYVFLL